MEVSEVTETTALHREAEQRRQTWESMYTDDFCSSVPLCDPVFSVTSVASVRRALKQSFSVEQLTIFHDKFYTAQILDVRQRVSVDHHQIRQLADLDAAQVHACAHCLGRDHWRG